MLFSTSIFSALTGKQDGIEKIFILSSFNCFMSEFTDSIHVASMRSFELWLLMLGTAFGLWMVRKTRKVYRDSHQSGLRTGLIHVAGRDWDLACNFLWAGSCCVRQVIVMVLVDFPFWGKAFRVHLPSGFDGAQRE